MTENKNFCSDERCCQAEGSLNGDHCKFGKRTINVFCDFWRSDLGICSSRNAWEDVLRELRDE